jgi:Peptidase family M28
MGQGSKHSENEIRARPSPSTMRQGSSAPRSRLNRTAVIGFVVVIGLTAFLGIYQLNPPDPAPPNVPPPEFSSGRAMKHLRVIAEQPHPMGTPAHAEVRQYIVQVLAEMGVSPEIQTTTVVNRRGSAKGGVPMPAGTVHNIVARLKGTAHGRAVLLAAHYDSVPTGPGASDDGAAVAAMLESLRALSANSPLTNDVIFLFTDGEEAGLLGATAFVDEHPWAKDVGLVLNFEARGTRGPSLMFETSADNGWLIKEFAKAAPYPVATSLSYEIYKRLPNDTDFTKFREAGLAGFNFAYINGYIRYHTALDSVQNIDERSLQHHGSYMIALTRHFGNLNLENLKASDVVFFNAFGSILVIYSQSLVVPLTISVALIFVGVTILGLRKGQLTLPGIALGVFVFLISVIVISMTVMSLWWSIQELQSEYKSSHTGDTYHSDLYRISFVLIAIALMSMIYTYFHRKGGVQNLAVGALFWWMILMIATSLYLPGGSYLFTWPLLFSSVGLGLLFAFRDQPPGSVKVLAPLALCAIPGIVLFTPLIYLLFVSLTLRLSGAVMVMVVLLLGLLTPHLNIITTSGKWLCSSIAALVAIGLLVAAGLVAGFDHNHAKANSVFYSADADTGRAIWASADEEPDDWTGQFFAANAEKGALPEYSPSLPGEFLKSPAPMSPLPAPHITPLADDARDGVRTLHMWITSPRQAPIISIYVDATAGVLGSVVNGKRISNQATPPHGGPERRWSLRYWALPEEGIALTLRVSSSHPVEIRVVDQSYGLPDTPGVVFKPRPTSMMPTPFGFGLSDATLVSKSFVF